MRRNHEADKEAIRGRRKKGEKANQKRMTCVGGVYTVDPFVRAPQNVVDEVLRDARKPDGQRSLHDPSDYSSHPARLPTGVQSHFGTVLGQFELTFRLRDFHLSLRVVSPIPQGARVYSRKSCQIQQF